MAISTTCPRCKALFRLADDMAGKKVQCQKCQSQFLVPAPNGATTAPGVLISDKSAVEGSMFDDSPGQPSQAAQDMNAAAEEAPIMAKVVANGTAEPSAEDAFTDLSDTNKDDDIEPSRKERRQERKPQSKTVMIAVISVLVGGGLLSCCACSGIGGFLIYTNQRKEKAMAAKEAPRPAWGGIDVVFDKTGTFHTDNVLDLQDPVEQFDPAFNPKRFKLYVARLEAGKSYQIDLVTNNFAFDAYLHVADDQKEIIARDDDGGGFPNARLVLTPQRTGFYRIYATSLQGNQLGNFALTVRKF